MRKKNLLITVLSLCLIVFYSVFYGKSGKEIPAQEISSSSSFELKKGDILVRPNWGWLPGSCRVEKGRKYGHVAVVTDGFSGNSVDEVLRKSQVIEALFFDQATRTFQFNKKDQIRETTANISFGPKFSGIRYRLRYNLTNAQLDSLLVFLKNQLDGGYDILSLKKDIHNSGSRKESFYGLKNTNWHCATLVWEAFYLSAAIDIDANGGWLVYPSDIVASPLFDYPGGRIRF